METYFAGFLGAGSMGGALAAAACKAVPPEKIAVTCSTPEHSRAAAERLGCHWADRDALIAGSRYLFLGIKPQILTKTAREIGPAMACWDGVLVSMLAGVSLASLEALFPGKRILRIMPNTPCAVGSGMILLSRGTLATQADAEGFRELMVQAGRIDDLPERLIDAASALTGCGPAFAFVFLQALADGAVACGLPRAKAREYTAQMLLGSARLALDTQTHPEVLKDAVCSPGGSTIAGVRALEASAFRSAAMEAVLAAYEKTKALG